MEKLDLKTFREFKQVIIDFWDKVFELEERNERLSVEEYEIFSKKYKEIIDVLSHHDLSDIDFEEWEGMILEAYEDTPLNFAETKANLDFSLIDYSGKSKYANFKSCQIKNFDFELNEYSPDMFDKEFRKENKDQFLPETMPEDIKEKFYDGELVLKDIKNYPELKNKISESNISWGHRVIYKIIGREEFCKLDAPFIDLLYYGWGDFLNNRKDLRTAEAIMPALYEKVREQILSRTLYPYPLEELGETFKELNPDLFLNENVPEDIKKDYYNRTLRIEDFSDNLEYFEGKKVAHAIGNHFESHILCKLYGDDIYQLFNNYKPMLDKLLEYIAFDRIDIPVGPLTEEQKNEVMKSAVITTFNDTNIDDLPMLKMITDFVPTDELPLKGDARKFLEKYDIDKLINIGFDIKYLTSNDTIKNITEIKKLEEVIDNDDLKAFIDSKDNDLIKKYGIDQLIEYGVQDLENLIEVPNDLNDIKETLGKIPKELINLGRYTKEKINFIEKYGVDNIIKLDKETKGIFSHEMWKNNIYLTMFAITDYEAPEFEVKENTTYEDFRNRVYNLMVYSRREGILKSGDAPHYNFIQGDFRKEHQEIFLDGDIPDYDDKDSEIWYDNTAKDRILKAFCRGALRPSDVKDNPVLIDLLQGKDLGSAFSRFKMTIGIKNGLMDANGNIIGGTPIIVNAANYLSNIIGQEEFLKICADYGKCLDETELITINENELNKDNIRQFIEDRIYIEITRGKLEYSEDMPENFKEQHPDLFLPEEIDEDIRKKFYKGELTYEDMRRNPHLKKILLSKDLSVGFGKMRYGQSNIDTMLSSMFGEGGRKKQKILWEIFSKEEVWDLAEKYGDYLRDVSDNVFGEGLNKQELENEIQKSIENNIINRFKNSQRGRRAKSNNHYSIYNENVPSFFRKNHPDMFLDDNAPEELKDVFYDDRLKNIPTSIFNDGIAGLNFKLIKEHPEWNEFLIGKELKRAFPTEYYELFDRFGSPTLMKIGLRNPQMIEQIVINHREETLENWYKSTAGKFLPHHVVMLNFPEAEIDGFLGNIKWWSQLMKIEEYSLNDDAKSALLKSAYSMGVFHGESKGFNEMIKLFTGLPKDLSKAEYEKVIETVEGDNKELIEQVYKIDENKKYTLRYNEQADRNKTKNIRNILEKAELSKVLTPQKAHQIFGAFSMEYNPAFTKFFIKNVEQIISDPEYTADIASMQRQFKDITRTNAGRTLTLEAARDYVKSIVYEDIEIGNEGVAEQAKLAGYTQEDFEELQKLYNEGETRDFSSIPRIQGKLNGYTYEMLRCDDPLTLTIGHFTDCCQEINNAGQTSMEHSMVSPDGRVFVVRDNQGRIAAQSWFWRNQYVGCFDNIEIPDKIFDLYEKEHPEVGKQGLTKEVLEVYKKAATELMKEDEKVYKELLENEIITQEQYDSLLLGKVTIGLGYNDIADAIESDKSLHEENEIVGVKKTDRLPNPYTDAGKQYGIVQRENIVKSDEPNLYVHQDEIPVYDSNNMTNTILLTMKRMEQAHDRDNLAYVREQGEDENTSKSQKIINGIAEEYELNPDITKIIATARIAIIYSKENEKTKIADVFSAPIKSDLTQEQREKAEKHVMYQLKKALKQLEVEKEKLDISSLEEDQKQMIEMAIEELAKEERGER